MPPPPPQAEDRADGGAEGAGDEAASEEGPSPLEVRSLAGGGGGEEESAWRGFCNFASHSGRACRVRARPSRFCLCSSSHDITTWGEEDEAAV